MDVIASVRFDRGVVLCWAFALPLVLAAAFGALREDVTATTAALVLVLVVVAAAATGFRAAGVVAALSSGAWFDYFLTEPYRSLKIDHPEDLQAAVLLLVIGLAVGEIALWGRRQQAQASRRAGFLAGVLGAADVVAAADASPDERAARVAHQVAGVLEVDECRFERLGAQRVSTTGLRPDGSVWRAGHEIDVARHGLPTDDVVALEVMHDGATLGRLALTASLATARPTLEQRRLAIVLADQLGSALACRRVRERDTDVYDRPHERA